MSRDSFVFNFNVNNFSCAAPDFPKSNVVELERSKWYFGVEKTQCTDYNYCKILNIFLTCERGVVNGTYTVNSALILRGSVIDVLFTKTHYFEPLDLEMPYFKIDCSYIFDKDNGFINEDGECEIMAEISVTHVVTQAEVVEIDPFLKRLKDTFLSSKNISGIINLQAGYRVPVNKELLSSHSEYFNNIFNNEHFEESSQESIDLTDFTYKQFRLLHKHIDQRRHFYKDTAEFRKAVEFRLKSEGRVTEFKRLWNFADIKAYSHKQRANYRCIGFRTRSDYKLFNDTLDMVDDVTQIRALLGLFFCVSTKYKLIENQMVSAENIEDLLCVGSYFQISKILERCKEFLRRNYADFSRQRRKELVEKYNLSSVTVPAMDDQREAQSDLSSTELFVYVNFLDTDKEEMCSVKYEEEITIKMLYSFALTQIYSQGNCNHPSEYEFDRVRISDPNRRFTNDCQSEDIDDNDTIMYHFARAYRIYSFDVRKAAVSSTSTRFSAKMPPKIYYYRDKFIHEIPVHVNFLDTDDEEMCSIDYENGMTIQTLFFNALLHLFYKGNGRRPSNYEIETVGIAYPNILSQSVDVEDDAAITSRYVCKSCRYSFEARKISTEDLTYSPSKTIPFIYDSYTKKVKFDQENEEESEPKASTSGQTQNISVRFETAYQLQNIRRSISATPNTILIHIIFSDSQQDEICQVDNEDEMKVCDLVQRMFAQLRRENHTIERDYEASNVRIFYPGFYAEPINLAMQDIIRPWTESVIYDVHLKRREV